MVSLGAPTPALADPSVGKTSNAVAVIDIGSNSVRLVVYEGASRTPFPIFNEKVLCGLGARLSETGRLDPEGIGRARATMQRFAALARRMQAARIEVIATAAVRDASDGPAFVAALEQDCDLSVRVLSGEDEARLSAIGVLAADPAADGVMGDLGGGSLELVALEGGVFGHCATLPLGTLRLLNGAEKTRARRDQVEQTLAGLDWLGDYRRRDLHIVGGSWRALGRIHMAISDYPLRILHGYEIPAGEVRDLCNLIGKQSRSSLRDMAGVSKGRLDTLPVAAQTLEALLAVLTPRRLVFSTYGLREGVVFEGVDPGWRQQDPLIAACTVAAQRAQRFPHHADEIFDWMGELFADETPDEARIRRAATLLSDIGWRMHPDYRAEQSLQEIVHAPIVGMSHRERAELALAVHHRYTGGTGGAAAQEIRRLLEPERREHTRRIGLALRLAHTLTGGVGGFLATTRLRRQGGSLRLGVAAEGQHYVGEVVLRRLATLAESYGLDPAVDEL